MRIRLHALVETEDSLERGDPVGDVEITEGGVQVRIDDADLQARVVRVLEEGLTLRHGEPSGELMITMERPVAPGDPDYPTALLERLEKPDLRLEGAIAQ